MIEIQYQRGWYDCGVACLAMVLDKSHGEIEKHLGRKVGDLRDPITKQVTGEETIGVMIFEMCAILWDFDIPHLFLSMPPDDSVDTRDPLLTYARVVNDMPVLRPLERVQRHLSRGKVAILGVPGHWIVAEGRKLFDPKPLDRVAGRRYTSLDEGEPIEVLEAILLQWNRIS